MTQVQTLATGLVLNPDSTPPPPERTIVCIGTPRGGTSMVAGAIAMLGVPMGKDLPENIEDPNFNPIDHDTARRGPFIDHVRQTVRERNATHPVWGWKYPRADRYLKDIVADLRNPRLVVVQRDPAPATIRGVRAARRLGEDEAAAAYRTARERLKVMATQLDMVEALGLPSYLLSYEKAVLFPRRFLRDLAGFVGCPLPDDVSPILEFMKPGKYKNLPWGSFDGEP